MPDSFAARLANVRRRFAMGLEAKIEDTFAAVPKLSGATPATVEAIEQTYRRIHNIVGIGPEVGFAATARCAKNAEAVLLQPQHAARGLTAEEVKAFVRALHGLKEAATRDLQAFYSMAG